MIAAAPQPVLETGASLHALACELYPLLRSLTGPGVRETLAVLGRHVPLAVREVPTGTQVFDWTVPPEWHCREAYIATTSGRRVIDLLDHNLHVVNFSTAVNATLSLSELRPHLHALPEHPHWIPYRTSYYQRTWGFCLTQTQLDDLTDATYHVVIDAEHRDGSLAYGECVLAGETNDEVLLSAHCCHPSLANDNLSGMAVAVHLAQWLATRKRRYTYRILFAPGTIGALCWLHQNPQASERVKHGLVLTLLGDGGPSTYKRTRAGHAEVDRAALHVLRTSGQPHHVCDFTPFGYDERQYNSPGFLIPVGCLMRTPPGEFPEYHSSADNLEFLRPESLADSFHKCRTLLEVLEGNRAYMNTAPQGEPQLGRRGLFRQLGGRSDTPRLEKALLWVLNYSDGHHDLLAIADRAGMPFGVIHEAAQLLAQHELLRPVSAEHTP